MKETNIQKDKELDLLEIAKVLLKGWRLLLFTSILSFFVSLTYALILVKPYYSSSVTLMLRGSAQTNLSSGLGMLGALGGGFIGGGSADLTQLELISQDPYFQMNFVKKYNLLPILYSPKWDSLKGDWKLTTKNDSLVPTFQDALREMPNVLETKVDEKKSIVVVTSTAYSAELSKYIVDSYVSYLDSILVHKKNVEAEEQIKHLKKRYVESNGSLPMAKFEELISSQYEQLALYSETAINIIIQSISPQKPNGPKKVLILIIGLFLGLTSSVVIILVRDAINRYR